MNTLQESASNSSSCKQWAEMIYYPAAEGKSERTAQVTTKLVLLLARILTCPADKTESVYADILMQLEYVRVQGQPSIVDRRIASTSQQQPATKRVITPEELEMSQIDLDETSGELLKSPGGGCKEQLDGAKESTLNVKDLQHTQEPEESSSQEVVPPQTSDKVALPCRKE